MRAILRRAFNIMAAPLLDGALFVALEAAGSAWHLTEGEADALAIASCLESGAGGKLFFHIMGARG